jgi:hypothetical protein
MIKLDTVERMEIIGELDLKTGYHLDYLNNLTDEGLLKLLKERG